MESDHLTDNQANNYEILYHNSSTPLTTVPAPINLAKTLVPFLGFSNMNTVLAKLIGAGTVVEGVGLS